MLDIIIDNLFRLESLGPAIIPIIVLLLWFFIIFITRKIKIRYQTSLTVALFLLLLSMLALTITLIPIARTLGEYAFLFLGVGTAQMLISKDG